MNPLIAARAGFRSEEHLRRAFRSRLNVLPHEYRDRFNDKSLGDQKPTFLIVGEATE